MTKRSSSWVVFAKLLLVRVSVRQAFWAANGYCALIECITFALLLWGGASIDAPPGGDSVLTRLSLVVFGGGLLQRLISVVYPNWLVPCILTSLVEYALMCLVRRGHGDLVFLASIFVLVGGYLRYRGASVFPSPDTDAVSETYAYQTQKT